MEYFTKDDLLMILNVYQSHVNDFINISEKDLKEIYIKIAKKDTYEISIELENDIKNSYENGYKSGFTAGHEAGFEDAY